MTDDRFDATLGSFYRDTAAPPPDQMQGVAEVMDRVRGTRQRGRRWPLPAFDRPRLPALPTRQLAPAPIPATNGHSPARGFTMFSALKFVAASVIVALFGGFLVMGVFTMQESDEVPLTAVTESPTQEATVEPTEAPTSTSVRSDILPGVELTVEEIEPGVFRVLNDGVRARFEGDIVAGHDGSVWLVNDVPGGPISPISRLGSDGSFQLPFGWDTRIVVTPDGTVWVSRTRGRPEKREVNRIHSLENGKWSMRLKVPAFGGPHALTVATDGTIWTIHPAQGTKDGDVVKRLGANGSERVAKLDFDDDVQEGGGDLVITESGELWRVPHQLGHSFVFGDDGSWNMVEGGGLQRLHGWDDGSEWQEVTADALVYDPGNSAVEIGTDGTVWLAGVNPLIVDGVPVRHEDSLIAAPAGSFVMRYDGNEWQRWGPDDGVPSLTWSSGLQLEQAPDGSLWVVAPPGSWFMPEDTEGLPFDGIARFDGSTWRYLLSGHDVSDWDIAPDGSVWLRADGALHVITPEAVKTAG